ncbi:hypothetical protein [Hugenholtzia roseola]|uniref:hypothetical protein n=1 Tax=Hugenholtzia roseola TaxID=1002 RepID=UPI00047E5640|nr:hypothetical protein [Hugenholtzia roseola]
MKFSLFTFYKNVKSLLATKTTKSLSFLLLLGLLFVTAPTLSSCRRAPAGEQTSEELAKKGKPKPKKCKIESCQVRMTHKHGGADFKGKRGNFFVRLFTPKESKYGQGLHRNHYKKK